MKKNLVYPKGKGKSLRYQADVLMKRHSDVRGGRVPYISVNRTAQLLGRKAAKYAFNIHRGSYCMTDFCNVYGNIEVLTVEGLRYALEFCKMAEISQGKYNGDWTPDFVDRPELAQAIYL